MIYKFTETDYNLNISDTIYYIYDKLNKGEKLNNNDKEYLHNYFSFNNGVCKLMGWLIDFREFLKCYYVETQYCGIQKTYAINKTYARKLNQFCGKIYNIQEVQK